jgi:hypothetical protein
MPTDPRSVVGTCASVGGPSTTWDGTFAPYMTGGAGAGAAAAGAYPWPPTAINGVGAAATALPAYTPTGTIATLPVPTFTGSSGQSISSGNGWFDADDTAPAPTPIAGCTYPDPWNAEDAANPGPCA